MSKRCAMMFLAAWVGLVLPAESLAFVPVPVEHAADVDAWAHTEHSASTPCDSPRMKCCTSKSCPRCGKYGLSERACANACVGHLTASMAVDCGVLPHLSIVRGFQVPHTPDASPPYLSRRFRPPIA